ncbi:helix-turn-helix domain-containing protein [Lactobacillus sp. ESL0679]|uniref:helix-turn-helix domain-containing protein n=1 Tax=Lactobacillus sp. ESL0679 TaxID=2983209 RepID=UPI0023F9C968|nr:Rgg/GadR/MutR family transcriptional regulator [Lactobacillus sp. ESL0679]MDF7682864.1 helix-turn-helix domain-containing protein [Lactobacillus sp. ESL0679]
MNLGELLKEYRLKQGKTKKEWAGNIISPSFYARVEKGVNRISAEDLIKLLQYNEILFTEFFNKFNSSDQLQDKENKEIDRLINEAYYSNSKEKLQHIRELILESNLINKTDKLLLVDVGIALVDNNFDGLDTKTLTKLKDKIFNIDNFDEKNIGLYIDCMAWFDFSSNLTISRKIVNRFINDNSKVQNKVLAVIVNMLLMCINYKQYDEAGFFINKSQEIIIIPENYFYQNVLNFLIHLIEYHFDNDKTHISKCKIIIQNFVVNGMKYYSEELEKLLDKNI